MEKLIINRPTDFQEEARVHMFPRKKFLLSPARFTSFFYTNHGVQLNEPTPRVNVRYTTYKFGSEVVRCEVAFHPGRYSHD